MKVSMFHFMPYRDIADDFYQHYESCWVDVPWHGLATGEKAHQFYNWSLDELFHAAQLGIDGVCCNEHHQNIYGMMSNPNLTGAILAKMTQGMDVAIVQIGATLTSSPPIRVAEEYAMLDCISGGRLVAGMPLGAGQDVPLAYGIPPIDMRGRYREAQELITRAWKSKEPFAFNGRYFQYPIVNPWPRPIQQPTPPIWMPGSSSVSTWDVTIDNDYCYCYFNFFGLHRLGDSVNAFWNRVVEKGKEPNPFRLGLNLPFFVAETDAEAERLYGRHIENFFHNYQHFPVHYSNLPGYQDYGSMMTSLTGGPSRVRGELDLKAMKYKDFVNNDFVIAGSVDTVKQKALDYIKRLRCGNLMALLHYATMPHDVTLGNIETFCKQVLPSLRPIWEDEWENHWWPERLRNKKVAAN
ncbi:MAG: Alkanesulfonate monooxygenase [Firmicutes bacterium]|nr:Alkanesulfonate monooxygenase [Bacillota bacterium]